jgi:hypothetical protein
VGTVTRSTLSGLAAGTYLALTPAQLKILRGAKGDRARRDHVGGLISRKTATMLAVADAWWFLKWLGGADITYGKRLHKGQMTRIELLDADKVTAAVASLAKLDLKKAFFAIDEAKFRYSSVAFWVEDKWKQEGRKTVLDAAICKNVMGAFARLEPFVQSAVDDERSLVFTTTF